MHMKVLHRAYMHPFLIQSNYAREHSHAVTELASRGLITTQLWSNSFGKHWRVSRAGLALLEITTLGDTDEIHHPHRRYHNRCVCKLSGE